MTLITLSDVIFHHMSPHHISVTALASAQEMSCMLEAYWMLSAKRFTDNICMLVDREILGEYLMG